MKEVLKKRIREIGFSDVFVNQIISKTSNTSVINVYERPHKNVLIKGYRDFYLINVLYYFYKEDRSTILIDFGDVNINSHSILKNFIEDIHRERVSKPLIIIKGKLDAYYTKIISELMQNTDITIFSTKVINSELYTKSVLIIDTDRCSIRTENITNSIPTFSPTGLNLTNLGVFLSLDVEIKIQEAFNSGENLLIKSSDEMGLKLLNALRERMIHSVDYESFNRDLKDYKALLIPNKNDFDSIKDDLDKYNIPIIALVEKDYKITNSILIDLDYIYEFSEQVPNLLSKKILREYKEKYKEKYKENSNNQHINLKKSQTLELLLIINQNLPRIGNAIRECRLLLDKMTFKTAKLSKPNSLKVTDFFREIPNLDNQIYPKTLKSMKEELLLIGIVDSLADELKIQKNRKQFDELVLNSLKHSDITTDDIRLLSNEYLDGFRWIKVNVSNYLVKW